MGKIFATDRNGVEHEIEARDGLNLMEVLREASLPVEGICGGVCICSTCHVYLDANWQFKTGERAEDEQVMVEDSGHYEKNSRLACQIEYSEELNGLRLTLAPEF
jgi:2Fe-2S ferredoxin